MQIQIHMGKIKRHGEGFETSPAPNRNASYGDSIMASKALPSPEVLRQLLRYDPETGKLFWLPRTADLFVSGHRTREGNCGNWNSRFAGREAFTADDGMGYRQGSIFGVLYRAHRVAFALMTGGWPTGLVDHIDGDGRNNRWANLRPASSAENARNKRLTALSVSGVKNVRQTGSGKWSSRITVDRKCQHLGTFDSIEDAAAAYAKASAELHGEFGRLE